MTTNNENDNGQLVRIQTRAGPRTFRGEVIVDLSRDFHDPKNIDKRTGKPRVRWTDMFLYRVFGQDFQYVVYIVVRSVVYHRPDGPCVHGVATRVKNLATEDRYLNMRPCALRGCFSGMPDDHLDDLDDDDVVKAEKDIYTQHKCADGQQVVESVLEPDGNIRGLGQRMLDEASVLDEGIAQVMAVEKPL